MSKICKLSRYYLFKVGLSHWRLINETGIYQNNPGELLMNLTFCLCYVLTARNLLAGDAFSHL